ncbi:hypothetical protein FSP39_022764 [Pinctada imbricata]|uniref:Uncharacterized protein n=1 Tax=Pinctada imbricata TaxID=66713 RepID=A0AA88XGB2_PINIB|nr:hypothetical protein FSP39_022764 [Pinctada imbricata]
MDPSFENLTSTELDDILRRFYAEVRNSQGELYSKSTFIGIRASINRHLRNPPHNKSISIMENKEFHKSNQMFLAVLKKLKQEGHDKTAHHPPISTNDLQLLHTTGVLSTDTPRSLQRKVWFDVTINFARRGRENLRELRYNCFEFKVAQ